ncbi:MAG: isocitrate/isopropylmalate family dehydrogenase [Thermodesulfobacteriota bacterium]|nr:isocitrate/isopropylmalate family dehydrogenase [Thermodesulfobacteriota bacterium]
MSDNQGGGNLGSTEELKIPLISGDGVGPELAEAARLCLDAVASAAGRKITFTEVPAGYSAYIKTGNPLPEETINAMQNSPATLLAAISGKDCPPPSPTGQIRKLLGLFADIRHCVSVRGSLRPGINLVIVRECSEGFLSDRNMFRGSGEFMPSPDVVLSVRVITREKCDQIAEVAFEYARDHGRRKITLAHKNVVFPLGCGLFRDRVLERARNYPEIDVEEEFVDGLARNLVVNPERYDMILTTNLFGDILADIAAAQVGNLIPIINASKSTALFYPAHGALSQLAGQQRVNPIAMIRSVSMMLHWLKLKKAGDLLDKAVSEHEDSGLGESLELPARMTTRDVTRSIVKSIDAQRSLTD